MITKEIINNTEIRSLKEKRILTYQKKVGKHKKMLNRICVKEEKSFLVVQGLAEYCQVKGYIKLPGNSMVERIEDLNLVINILPKDRMIIAHGEEIIFRGYKRDNTTEFMMIAFVKGECNQCIILDMGKENIPLYITIEECEDDVESTSEILFQIIEEMFVNDTRVNMKEISISQEEIDETKENISE